MTAGFAEVPAGSIAMGLGGYLAARSDAEHYASELAREEREIVQVPDVEATEVIDILQSYGVEPNEAAVVVAAMRRRPDKWRDFMMRFELGLEEPILGEPSEARSRSRGPMYSVGSSRWRLT